MIEEGLSVLSHHTGANIDAIWHLILGEDFDPVSVAKTRRFQKMFLARYGKQSVLQWDDYPISEFTKDFTELVDIVTKENPITRMED